MRAEYWAVATALCWAFGSLMEKQGLKLGNLSPVLGAGVRTAFSLALLAGLSLPHWGQLRTCGWRAVLLVAVGGGLLAGALGITSLYTGLKTGHISVVMTVAFCLTPVVGAVAGYFVFREGLSPLQIVGVVLCVVGAAMTLLFRAQPAG